MVKLMGLTTTLKSSTGNQVTTMDTELNLQQLLLVLRGLNHYADWLDAEIEKIYAIDDDDMDDSMQEKLTDLTDEVLETNDLLHTIIHISTNRNTVKRRSRHVSPKLWS